jgi:hypothetical protein
MSKYPGFSNYAFVNNCPLIFVDPDGRDIIPYHVTGQNNEGTMIYKVGELSPKMESVMRKMLMTPEGIAFLSQFAKAGDQIAGVTFKVDGKYSNHTLLLQDYSLENYEGNIPKGDEGHFSSSYNEKEGKIEFTLAIYTGGLTEAEVAATYTHESQLHGKTHVENFVKAAQTEGKKGYDKAAAKEHKINPNGNQDHNDLEKKDLQSPAYKNYLKQKKQVLEIQPNYKPGFDSMEPKETPKKDN